METVQLSYDVYKTGETRMDVSPIVLIHGLFWNKYMYKELAMDLCNATKRKVYCLDLRNHGESPVRDECSTLIMTEDVKRFLDEESLNRILFVCHSFSCTMAYLIALERPDSVEKIVMIDNPPFNTFSEAFTRESVAPQVEIQNGLLRRLDPGMELKDAKMKFYKLSKMGTKSQEYFFKKAAYDLTKKNGQFKWKINFELLMNQYFKGLYNPKSTGSSHHEILIIRCPNSGRVPDSKFETILKYNPRARLVTLEDTTHLLMFEKKEEFLDIVNDFLGES